MDLTPEPDRREQHADQHITRTLLWIGVAGLTAALAFTLVRVLSARRPTDATGARIQQLIDEANQLLKTLDEARNTA